MAADEKNTELTKHFMKHGIPKIGIHLNNVSIRYKVMINTSFVLSLPDAKR
jgi:hypothetical protein